MSDYIRSGESEEHRQGVIKKSDYHARLEEQGQSDEDLRSSKEVGDIRYWSDFNRLYHLPRSLQQLPDIPDWETTSLAWDQGQEQFTRFNEVILCNSPTRYLY